MKLTKTDNIQLQNLKVKAAISNAVDKEYPMQPMHIAKDGIIRFEENPIIAYLCRDVANLNDIAMWCIDNNIDQKYQEQLAQLIGYSFSGYGDLSYVSDESWERAYKKYEPLHNALELKNKHR